MENPDQPTPSWTWKLLKSERGPELPIFKVRFDWLENPRNAAELKAVVLEARDWVDVVAVTPEQKIVMVKQYRFGISDLSLEIPAGVTEPNEAPERAAKRELLEETGYSTDDWTYLGWVYANPAFLNNRCHQWLARNVRKTHAPHLDDGEHLEVDELTLTEVQDAVRAGCFRNSLGMLGLSKVFPFFFCEKHE